MTVREQLEDAVERAIDALDAFDGDTEAEPVDEREPDTDAETWEQAVTLV